MRFPYGNVEGLLIPFIAEKVKVSIDALYEMRKGD